MYHLDPILTAQLDIPTPLVLWRTGWGTTTRVAAWAWLLRSNSHAVLVDTGVGGIHTDRSLPQVGWEGEGTIWDLEYPTGIIDGLAQFGLSVSDIDFVIATHLHFDHAGNLPLFRNARVVVSAEGWSYARSRPHRVDARYAPDLIEWLDQAEDQVLTLPRVSEPIPGIAVNWVGGHTPCSQVVTVDTHIGPVLLPGDVVPSAGNLRGTPTGNYQHLTELVEATAWISGFEGTVIPSHDPNSAALIKAAAL